MHVENGNEYIYMYMYMYMYIIYMYMYYQQLAEKNSSALEQLEL
jgi:hypothetical protein